MTKAYAIRDSKGNYLGRHHGVYKPFSAFATKFFVSFSSAMNTDRRESIHGGISVVEFSIEEVRNYEA